MDNSPVGLEPIVVTDTRQSEYAPFWKTRARLFAQDNDPKNPGYCFATLFVTKFYLPIYPIATFWLKKRDRNTQTWYAWQPAGVFEPKHKILYGKKVDLRIDQVRWVKMIYWYFPLACIAIGLLNELWQLLLRLI